MNETAHTATWVAIQDAGYWRVVFADDDATVAYIANGPEQEKHARLIAAAPTMFDFIARYAAAGDAEAVKIMPAEVAELIGYLAGAQR